MDPIAFHSKHVAHMPVGRDDVRAGPSRGVRFHESAVEMKPDGEAGRGGELPDEPFRFRFLRRTGHKGAGLGEDIPEDLRVAKRREGRPEAAVARPSDQGETRIFCDAVVSPKPG
jgi:hypothetical protein